MADSTAEKDLEKDFILAVFGEISSKDSMYRVSTLLCMDRSDLDKDFHNNQEDVEASGKCFCSRWYAKNQGDPARFRMLNKAFEKVNMGGVFESVQNKLGFEFPDDDQMELLDESLDEKLIKFLEELPCQISTKNILWDVGIYGGCSNEDIEAIKTNNPGNITQAGRELVQFILKKKKGPLRKKVLDFQTCFEKAKKIYRFNQLLDEHGISQDDLTANEEQQGMIDVPHDNLMASADSEPGSLRHFDSLVPPETNSTTQPQNLHQIARAIEQEGQFQYNDALRTASRLTDPTVESVRDYRT